METIADWYIKDRVIFHRPVGEETIEIVQQNNDDLIKLLDKGTPAVHIIVDARYITKIPTNLLKLSKATSFLSHPSIGWVITISNSPLITFLGGMLPQIGSLSRYRVVSEPNNCLNFLKEQDSTLNWSTVNDELFTK
jgi:hypothetical protein